MKLAIIFSAFGLFTIFANGQEQRSPAELMAVLHDQPADFGFESAVFSCGITDRERQMVAAAGSLAAVGVSALPVIDEAIVAFEKPEIRSDYTSSAGLLFSVYAKIGGPASAPRLRALLDKRSLEYLQGELNEAVATSLGITSYISFRPWTSVLGTAPIYCGPQDPRDGLNLLLLAWLSGNRSLLEASLGPDAQAALKLPMSPREWKRFRANFWRGSCSSFAAGYLFDASGALAEARMKSNLDNGAYPIHAQAFSTHPRFDTVFKSSLGADCGTLRIDFSDDASTPMGLRYKVNNTNIREVLRMISGCAAKRQ